ARGVSSQGVNLSTHALQQDGLGYKVDLETVVSQQVGANQDVIPGRKRDLGFNRLPIEREIDEQNILLDTLPACQDGETRRIERGVQYLPERLRQFQVTVEAGVNDRPAHLPRDGQHQNRLPVFIYMTNQEPRPPLRT